MSTYSNLSVELIGTGEQSGTWGTTTNTNLGTALEEAIVGTVSQAVTTGDTTLTWNTSSNASQTARHLRLNLTGSSGGVGNLIVPTLSSGKNYIIKNSSDTAITVKTTAGTGILVPAGKSMELYQDGTNVVDTVTYLSSLTLGSVLPITSGGTGTTSTTFTNLTTNVTGTLPVGNGGTGTTSTTFTNLTTNVTGTLPVGNGGTGATTLTGVVKGSGTSTLSAATAGTDYVAPGTATTFTAKQTFSGSTSVISSKFTNATEVVTVSATAATGTINYDTNTQSVLYYTTAAAANWTVNFRASSGTSLDTAMVTGESITVVFSVTTGATAYYNNAITIDGVSVTPKYQGGSAWTAGNASSIDVYSYSIIKTGSATFTVLASQTQFK